jgi:signal transduction histidine kinase
LEEENKKLVVLEERNRIAREIHDSIVQSLYGVNLQLNTIDYLAEHQPQDLPKVFTQLKQMVAEIQAEMRLMIYELKPTVFMEESFSKADPTPCGSMASIEEQP